VVPAVAATAAVIKIREQMLRWGFQKVKKLLRKEAAIIAVCNTAAINILIDSFPSWD
jgi:hypothetical protein